MKEWENFKSKICAWLSTMKEPVTFRQICEQFADYLGNDIYDALTELINNEDIEVIPPRYKVKE